MAGKTFWQNQFDAVREGESPALTVEQQQEREKPQVQMEAPKQPKQEEASIEALDVAKAGALGVTGWAESMEEVFSTPDMRQALSGTVPGMVLSLADYVPFIKDKLTEASRGTAEQFASTKESIRQSMTEPARKALESELINEDLEFTDDATKLSTWIMKGTETLSRMAPDLIAGGLTGKALYKSAYETAYKSGLAKGLTEQGAKVAANKIASASMAAPTAIIATTSATGSAGVQARESIESLSWADLQKSDLFVNNFKRIDADPANEGLSDREKLNLARTETAEYASSKIMQDPKLLTVNALSSFIGDATLGKLLAGKIGGGIVNKMVTGAAAEAPTEAAQSAMEQYAQNMILIDVAGQDVDETKGVARSALEGGLLGGVIGGGVGGVSGVVDKATGRPQVTEPDVEQAPEVMPEAEAIPEAEPVKLDRSKMTVPERRAALEASLESQRAEMDRQRIEAGRGEVQERLSRPVEPTPEELIFKAREQFGPTPGELEFREQGERDYIERVKEARTPEGLKGKPNAIKMMNKGYRKALQDFGGLSSSMAKSTKPDPRTDSMSEIVAKMGGISRSDAESEGFDPAMFKGSKTFSAKGKMSFDDAAEALNQEGFRTPDGQELSAVDVVDMLYGEVNNTESHFSTQAAPEMMTADAQLVRGWANSLGGTDKLNTAVSKALAGEKLGKRQAEIVEDMLDTVGSMRAEDVQQARAELETRREDRNNRRIEAFNQQFQEATGMGSHIADVEAYSEMLSEMPDHYSEEQVILDELVSTAGDQDFFATSEAIEQYESGKTSLPQLLTRLSNITQQKATTYAEAKPAIQKVSEPAEKPTEGVTAERIKPSETAPAAEPAEPTARAVEPEAKAEPAGAPETEITEEVAPVAESKPVTVGTLTAEESALSTEQRAKYDQLPTEAGMAKRGEEKAAKAVKKGLDVEGVDVLSMEPGAHGKTGEPIVNIKFTQIGKDEFKKAAAQARAMGGGYWRGNFYVPDQATADQFVSWVKGESIDLSEKVSKSEALKEDVKIKKLLDMADKLESVSKTDLESSRRENTARQMRMADSSRANAESNIEFARILRAIAKGTKDGSVKYLSGLSNKTQLEAISKKFNGLKYQIPQNKVDQLTDRDGNSNLFWKSSIPVEEKVQYAKYPLIDSHVSAVDRWASEMADTGGYKQAANALKKLTKGVSGNSYLRLDPNAPYFGKLQDYLKSQPNYVNGVESAKDFTRLQRIGIDTPAALRTALIEFDSIKRGIDAPTEKTTIQKMERDLKRKVRLNRNAFNDFFPTPQTISDDVVGLADIQPGMKVLEPSAGNGELADAMSKKGVDVDAVELASDLRMILQEKGYNLVGDDFTQFKSDPVYDRIVMNPPFSNDQDIDHVRHAYSMLKPGGRLVAIVSSMAGDRSNSRNREFKDWFSSLDGEESLLPSDAFMDSLNPTAVRTKTLVIDKPESADAPKAEDVAGSISFSKDSIVTGNPKGMHAKEADLVAKAFIKEYKGAANVKVTVFQTQKQVMDYLGIKDNPNERRNAVYTPWNSEVVLVADNLNDAKNAREKLRHEILAHHGLMRVVGQDEWQNIVNLVSASRSSKGLAPIWSEIDKLYSNADENAKAEEVIAKIAEIEPSKLSEWGNRIISAVIRALRKVGFITDKITQSEIRNIIRIVGERIKTVGDGKATLNNDIKFSLQQGSPLTPEFKRWFGKSKAVDYSGDPLVVYHGSGSKFSTFDKKMAGSFTGAESAKKGFFFTESNLLAESFATEAQKQNLNLKDIKSSIEKLSNDKFDALYDSLRLDNYFGDIEYMDSDEAADVRSEAVGHIIESIENDATAHPDDRSNYSTVLKKYIDPNLFNVGEVKSVYLKIENPLVVEFNNEYQDKAITSSIDKAIKNGNDGVIFKGMKDAASLTDKGEGFVKSDVYVVFEPNQIKSATDNIGAFDPSSSDIMFSKSQLTSEDGFSIPDETRKDAILRSLADKYRRLKITQKAIKEQGGVIGEEQDVYLAEELFHGKIGEDLRVMEEQYIKPLTEFMGSKNISSGELDLYLIAKHAPERNAQIAKINPEMPDGGSGMTNAEASAILQRFNAEGRAADMAAAADFVYGMLNSTKQRLVSSGLETGDVVEAWDATYQNYVPLKGFAENEIDAEGNKVKGTGKGFSIHGKETMRAMGRRTIAESPIAYAVSDSVQSAIRARKNEVAQSMLSLVNTNPDPELWEVFTNENPDTTRQIVKRNNPETGKVEDQVVVTPMPMFAMKDKYLGAKVGGEQYYIKLKDPRLMEAMANLGADQAGQLTMAVGKMTRLLSAMITSYNPEFALSNFARDVQTAVYNVLAEAKIEGGKALGTKDLAKKMVMDLPDSFKTLKAGLRDNNFDGEWGSYFKEYLDAGAKTGWFVQKDIDDIKSDIQRAITTTGPGAKNALIRSKDKLIKFVDDYNDIVENASRLSVYVNARRQGLTEKQAASLAKNLTVNFNRKGELSNTINALYMFFNASIQGTANMLRAVMTPADKSKKIWDPEFYNMTQKIAMALPIATFAMAQMNREWGGDDDDGKAFYDKVPSYLKETNFIFMIPGGEGDFIKIPMPYGYNFFAAMGSVFDEVINENKTPIQGAFDSVAAFAGAFSPLGSVSSDEMSKQVIKTATPSLLKPFVEMATNENFTGSPIYKEQNPFGLKVPDAYNAQRRTWEWAKGLSEFLNDVTGGNEFKSGVVDIAPETWQHLAKFAGGGLGALFGRSQDLVVKTVKGEDVESRDIPFFRKYIGSISESVDIAEMYNRFDEIKVVEKQATMLPGKERVQYIRENRQMVKLVPMAKAIGKEISNLNSIKKQINASKLPDDVKQARIEKIEEKKRILASRFNKRYNESTSK